MVEDTRLVSTHEHALGLDGEEKEVETLVQVPVGENVRAPGSDVLQGDLVLQKGERINSGGGEIGTLAFVSRKEVDHLAFFCLDDTNKDRPHHRSRSTSDLL